MFKICKLCIADYPVEGATEIIAVELHSVSDDFKSLNKEIAHHFPDLKNKNFKFSYEDSDGDKITILNNNDFKIFLKQDLKKIFISKWPKDVMAESLPEKSERTPKELELKRKSMNASRKKAIRGIMEHDRDIPPWCKMQELELKEESSKSILSRQGVIFGRRREEENLKRKEEDLKRKEEDLKRKEEDLKRKEENSSEDDDDIPELIGNDDQIITNISLDQMIARGYTNESGWLTMLLESGNGDVKKANEKLQPKLEEVD